jgi:hypothetical protein
MTTSINNYTVGKGIVSFRKDGAGAYADMGNCTEFEFTPELEKLDHFSSREGVRTKDKSIVIQKSGTVRLVLDEWTRDNIALAVLGTNAIVGGQSITEIFDSNAIKGSLKFTGTNEVGPKYEWVFPAVEFVPSSSISLLSDEWGTIELTGDVLISGGSFGTITALGESVPVNTVLPSIAGIAQEGEPLVAIVGEWSGTPVFSYQWKNAGVNIPGATGATYTPVTGDVSDALSVAVTATNAAGSTTVTSAATAAVIAAA